MYKKQSYFILANNLRAFGRMLIVSYGGAGATLLVDVAKGLLGADNIVTVSRKFKDKNVFFKKMTQEARRRKMALCDTATLTDLIGHPHGRKQEIKWNVLAPLAMAGITRKDAQIYNRTIKNHSFK